MYPNLYFAFYDIFGVKFNFLKPFQTFGLFLVLAFISAYLMGIWEMNRLERLNVFKPKVVLKKFGAPPSLYDFVSSACIGFILGFKVLYLLINFSVFVENAQSMLISAQGYWWGGLLGIIIPVGLIYYEGKKNRLPQIETREISRRPWRDVAPMVLIAAISGIIGSKFFHLLENLGNFFEGPMEMLFSSSGFTIYGGLIFGTISVSYYGIKKGHDWYKLSDVAAPCLLISYGIGRMGCHISGDGDWGITNSAPMPDLISFLPEWIWSYRFPNNLYNVGIKMVPCEFEGYCHILPQGVFPTSFYEMIMCLFLFAILCALRTRVKIPGGLFAIYLVFNGFERFLIESIRVNNKFYFLGLEVTQAQVISSILFIGGIGWFQFCKHRMKRLELIN